MPDAALSLIPCENRYPSRSTAVPFGLSAKLANSAAWVLRLNGLAFARGVAAAAAYARPAAGGRASCTTSQSSSITRVKRR